MKVINLAGNKFGRLFVLEREKNVKNRTMWLCRCECGNEVVVGAANLRYGHTKSCGCLSKEKASARATKHGAGYEPWYGQWKAMIRRMTNQKDVAYNHYVVEKGLFIEKEFIDDPWAFYAEIGEFPGNGYTIERIDNDKGYIKGNICWATQAENNKNKGIYKNNKSGVSGIAWNKARNKWVVMVNWNKKKYYGGIFEDLEKAKIAHKKITESKRELGD